MLVVFLNRRQRAVGPQQVEIERVGQGIHQRSGSRPIWAALVRSAYELPSSVYTATVTPKVADMKRSP